MTLNAEYWQRRREAVLTKLAALDSMYPPAVDIGTDWPDDEDYATHHRLRAEFRVPFA